MGHLVSQHDDVTYARFQCRVCLKRFYGAHPFQKHIKSRHRATDPKKDMIRRGECFYPDCGKTYTGVNRAECLKYHLVAAHRDRDHARYECEECDRLFYDRTSWRKHMRSKHGQIIETFKK